MKTIIVTGACGFIGSAFVRLAVAKGKKVVVLDALTYAGHKESLEGVQSCELVVGDICNAGLVRELLQKYRPEALVHFAAESHVDRSIDNPGAFVTTNVNGTFTLLHESLSYWNTLTDAAKTEFRYLQVSTDEVYGTLGPTGKFSETTAYAPNSPYSASKAAGDLLARAWFHTYGMPTVTTNCSNNYGARQYPEKLIPLMIAHALNGKALPVYGDGGNIRDWIHVDDHSAGVWLALEKGRPGETYCFGGNAERTNMQVVKTLCAQLDSLRPRSDGKSYETTIEFVKDRPGHDRRYAIDDTKAQNELGFKRQYDFETGIRQTIEWYLQNADWVKAVTGGKVALPRIGQG